MSPNSNLQVCEASVATGGLFGFVSGGEVLSGAAAGFESGPVAAVVAGVGLTIMGISTTGLLLASTICHGRL